MINIGIVGAGIAGLHLGLFLRQHGITATIYADRTPDQLRASRLVNNPARFGHTRTREQTLGIDHWTNTAPDLHTVSLAISGERPLSFTGQLSQPGSYIDMRLYQPTLLGDFWTHGGEVLFGPVQAEHLPQLSMRHDLLVIAAGRGSLVELFPRITEHSPYKHPQRLLCLGYFDGIMADPHDVSFVIAPGQGEVFQTSTYTADGVKTGLLFEALPGSALEIAAQLRYEDDPQHFDATILGLLREYAPPIYARINPEIFHLTHPLDLLQGAVTPTVRQNYALLSNGRPIMSLGDVHVTNDPLAAQGGNAASYAAWILGEEIRDRFGADEAFCQRVSQRLWAYLQPVTAWSNVMLQPPAPHLLDLLAAAAGNPLLANAFVDGFNMPVETWELLQSPTRVAALLDTFSSR